MRVGKVRAFPPLFLALFTLFAVLPAAHSTTGRNVTALKVQPQEAVEGLQRHRIFGRLLDFGPEGVVRAKRGVTMYFAKEVNSVILVSGSPAPPPVVQTRQSTDRFLHEGGQSGWYYITCSCNGEALTPGVNDTQGGDYCAFSNGDPLNPDTTCIGSCKGQCKRKFYSYQMGPMMGGTASYTVMTY